MQSIFEFWHRGPLANEIGNYLQVVPFSLLEAFRIVEHEAAVVIGDYLLVNVRLATYEL